MSDAFTLRLRPDLFGQLAATDPYQGRARRLFERGQVVAVGGNQADILVGYDARGNPLELKEVPIVSGYLPQVGDWVSVQYEAGHSAAPWVTGPSMAADESRDPAGIGVFSVASAEPENPQPSLIYFDESRETWRGWDGATWVDFASRLHNDLPDLQGGETGAYYHLTDDQHGAIQDLCDGDGLASAWVRRLNFRAIDASGTARTRLFEKDGDFFWAINASYDEATGHWNRIDVTKYAYLVELRSENGIPCEPIGGIAWWRAVPGDNPIGDYTAFGGWELGWMMTEHRNYVMGGMNLEMDGSGASPYGRFTQIGANDESGTVVTAIQRNSWYEGSGQWGRDSHDKHSAIIGFGADADLFVWWYPDSSEGNAPWQTSDWQRRVRLRLGGDGTRGRLDVIRSSAATNLPGSSFLAKHKTSGDMADGFASGYLLAVEDSAGVENIIAAMYGERAGADDTGALSWRVASGGVLTEGMRLDASGDLSIGGAFDPAGGMSYSKLTYSGLTAGQVLRATGASAAEFMQLSHSDLGGVSADQHHAKAHVLAGSDHTASGLTAGQVLQASGPTAFAWSTYALTLGANSAINQDVRTTGTPQLARLGLGGAADASAKMKAAGQYFSALYENGNGGSSKTIDWDNGNVQKLTLNAATCNLTLSNPKSGGRYLLILMQDATGGRAVGWPSAVKWPGGTAPTLSGASKVDVITLVYDGTYYYCGSSLNYL